MSIRKVCFVNVERSGEVESKPRTFVRVDLRIYADGRLCAFSNSVLGVKFDVTGRDGYVDNRKLSKAGNELRRIAATLTSDPTRSTT